jgi:hypothetical protein
LLVELFKKLQKELKDHEGLTELNQKRYEQKVASATSDDDGLNALEELLSSDPDLAEMFGSMVPGRVAAKTINAAAGKKVAGKPEAFKGLDFPTYFKRADGTTEVDRPPRGGPVVMLVEAPDWSQR